MANISKINFKGVEYDIKPLMDATPTQGSANAVQSGGVYSALAGKVDAVSGKGLSTNDYTNADKQAVTNATTDLTAITTATTEDVGKALKAKTVSGGKVIEWEFGEAGGDSADLEKIENDLYKSWGTVEETIEPTITAGEGYKSADGTVGTVTQFKRTDLIDVSAWSSAKVSVYAWNGWAGVCFYDSNRAFIECLLNDDVQYHSEPVTFPAGTHYMAVSSHNAVPITITAVTYTSFVDVLDGMRTATSSDEGKVLKAKTVTDGKVTEWEFGEAGGTAETDTTLTESGVPADAKATGDAINEVKNAWGTLTDTLVPSVTSGEYYKISDGTVGTYTACRRTDLIDISGWVSANVTCYGLSTNFAGVCYYDKNRSYISGEYGDGRYTDAPLHIPANAKYIGVSSHNSFTISITYTRYITPSEVANVIDDLKAKVIDGYLDKNIVLFGDSITTELHKYVPALKQIMKFKSITNYARGYCRWSFFEDTVYDITSTGNTGTSDNVIWNQYNRLVADVANEIVAVPDAIIIMAGTNDAIYNSNVGTVADAMAIADIRSAQVGTLNNVCASIRRVIEDIFATFPYTKVIICTPIQSGVNNYQTRLATIVPYIREICGYYSIDVPDMFKDAGISYYIEKDADVYLSSGDGGIHPTEAGGKLMANFMKAWLTSHYGYDETITKTYVAQS